MLRVRFALLALVLCAHAAAQTGPSIDGAWYTPPVKSTQTLMARDELPSARATNVPPVVVLSPFDASAVPAENKFGQTPLGASRTLPDLSREGAWDTLPDGRRIWRVAVTSPGAVALRARFESFSVGLGRVWVYGGSAPPEQSYTGAGTLSDGQFWSATVFSDTLTVEYEPETPPSGNDPPPFRVSDLAHFWAEPMAGPANPQVAACNLDYSCYPQWATPGRSVAHIVFQADADRAFYVCSGSLLNTIGSSFTPYFLTANHCIGTDSEARSLQAYWLYQTSECNGPAVSRSSATRIDGARLLTTADGPSGDFSLVLLSAVPNASVHFAGWSASEPAFGDALTAIHHPTGSYKRIAFGQRSSDANARVSGQVYPATRFYQVRMNEGRIEAGSSGSPLFDANSRVTGVLSYGPASPPGETACDIADFRAGYGRFSVAYPSLRDYLEDAIAPTVSISPRTLTFRVVDGVLFEPVSQTLRIEGQSSSAVDWTLDAFPSWIRLSLTAGSVTSASAATVGVTIDPASLQTPGTYSGTITLRAGSSVPQTVTVQVQSSSTRSAVVPTVTPNPVYEQPADSAGFRWFYELRLEEKAGLEVRLTSFRIDGTDFTSRIQDFFGTDRIAPLGSIATSLRASGLTVPVERVYEFAGVESASGTSWSARLAVQFLGRRTQATVQVTISPNPVTQDTSSESCPWRHSVTLTEQSGIGLDLNRWIAGGFNLSTQVATWFGRTRLDPNGTLRTNICWRNIVTPATLDFEVGGTDDQGNDVRASASARFTGAATTQASTRVAPEHVGFTGAQGSASTMVGAVSITTPSSSQAWTARLAYSGTARNWLTVFPLSGTGSATIAMGATAAGLALGRYAATLTVEAPGATPARFDVSVELNVAPQQPAAPVFTAAGVVNAATFRSGLSPGMLFTIVGQNLATGVEVASQVPLPSAMAGATVRVNGVVCPLLYVSPAQINAQIPYETRTGQVTVVVNVEGRETSQTVTIQTLAPGVFTLDGQRPAPHTGGQRGEVRLAYITGAGSMTPAVQTGAAPATTVVSELPRPVSAVSVTVGGAPAIVEFAGIPPGLVGAVQINYRIPANAPLGAQPLVVTVGTSSASPVTIDVR